MAVKKKSKSGKSRSLDPKVSRVRVPSEIHKRSAHRGILHALHKMDSRNRRHLLIGATAGIAAAGALAAAVTFHNPGLMSPAVRGAGVRMVAEGRELASRASGKVRRLISTIRNEWFASPNSKLASTLRNVAKQAGGEAGRNMAPLGSAADHGFDADALSHLSKGADFGGFN